MKESKYIWLLGIIALMVSGCWIALPSDGPPGAKDYVGLEYQLHRDILIGSYWITPISWDVSNKDEIGANQKVLETLKAGNEIRIVSIKSFRLPSGVSYSYRCIAVNSGTKFDLGFSMLDCIGLPKNLGSG
jgi:hypothetical protein